MSSDAAGALPPPSSFKGPVAFDTETTGLCPEKDSIFGICLATNELSLYADVRMHRGVFPWLREVFRASEGPIVCCNANFDIRFLAREIEVNEFLENIYDVMWIARCLNENLQSYSLDFLAARWLKEHKVDDIYEKLAELYGGRPTRQVQMRNLHKAPEDVVAPYGRKDAELTLRLFNFQMGVLEDHPELRDIVEFEKAVFPRIYAMENMGIRVDIDAARKAQEKLRKSISEKQLLLDEMAGRQFNVNSGPQVKALFKPEPAGPKSPKPFRIGNVFAPATGTGAPSLGSEVMRELADNGHEAAQLILEIRSLLKTNGTFLEKHIISHEHNGRVHPRIFQYGTSTGRLAVRDPALQQIPSRNKEVAEIVKSCFLPDEGQVWLDADLASFEVRVFAHLIEDPEIIRAYQDDPNTDFHQMVADMTNLVRNAQYSGQPNAKQLNLSMIFNSGNGAIAEKMGMSWSWEEFDADDGEHVVYKKAGPEAMEVILNYHDRLPGVKKLAKRCEAQARSKGYIMTECGRKIRFPDREFAYKASGLLIQSTAADLNKIVIDIVSEVASWYDGRLMLNTHDSYSVSLPLKNVKEFWRDVNDNIAERLHWFRVPILMELNGVGHNWWLALENELEIEL